MQRCLRLERVSSNRTPRAKGSGDGVPLASFSRHMALSQHCQNEAQCTVTFTVA